MSDMIERVARAIWRTRESQFPERVRRPEPDAFDNASGAWAMILDQARAAIEAMREPTEEMNAAMRSAHLNIVGGYDSTSSWEAAINAALGKAKEEL